ncbi:MAG TPA: hypothetical protein VHI11_10770 [Jiangellaceae bacterium]|nr:hypothetical protein [Jiangellaceae bacterium]
MAAQATLSELAAPPIGIRTMALQAGLQAALIPVVSFPTTSNVGPARSYPSTLTGPDSSVPTIRAPRS